ncbi:MAG: hypothetical protein E7490_09385 [Ruminococcaceae bacterium]|nr:hypothetical protein [Oscillospiraceae bacterium]
MNKKFKAIVAGTMAAATVATTAVALTASAAAKTFWFDTTGDVYGGSASENVIHYSQLELHGYSDDYINYKTVEKDMTEGNKILTVDFSKDPTAKKKKIESWVKSCVDDYMEDLYLKNSLGGDVSGKYTLEALQGSKSAQFDVMVVPGYRLTSNFDITGVSLTPYREADGKNSTTHAWLNVNYKINGGRILIDDNEIKVYGCNSSREFTRNLSDFYTEGAYTTGTQKLLVPLSYAGSTRAVTINGTNVGTVTLPKLSSNFHIGFDRYILNLTGTYKNV